jgi:hypothetical protein
MSATTYLAALGWLSITVMLLVFAMVIAAASALLLSVMNDLIDKFTRR